MKPDIHCFRTHWIRGFMAFEWARRVRIVVLMVPTWPESGFSGKVAPGCGPLLSGIAPEPRERGIHDV
jgi:hypothetical protein